MKYMGSKRRIVKHILPIILQDRIEGQTYVEPFVGGANIIEHVSGPRIGCDNHFYLIAFYHAIQSGWLPKPHYTEEDYQYVKDNPMDEPYLTGYMGFALSYGGKWFGGWSRDVEGIRDYADEAFRNLQKQLPKIQDVKFVFSDYRRLEIPANSIIYCDPPYKGSTRYHDNFDHDEFWEWGKQMSDQGHKVYVSEYSAPSYVRCLWEKTVSSSLTKDTGSKIGIERLFTY